MKSLKSWKSGSGKIIAFISYNKGFTQTTKAAEPVIPWRVTHPGSMALNFSVRLETGVSNKIGQT